MRRRLPIGLLFLSAGTLHLLRPAVFEVAVPRVLPARRALVYASGVAELAGGAAVLSERGTRLGGWWLIATLVAVFPANVTMAVEAERFRRIPEPLLWARLPLQAALIAWVWDAAIRR